jgi:hypothetical protein
MKDPVLSLISLILDSIRIKKVALFRVQQSGNDGINAMLHLRRERGEDLSQMAF